MNRLKQWTLVAVGVLFVGLGALGVALPGLPTTPFLLVASWCFVRSSPALEQRLVRSRFFAPYRVYLDGQKPIPRRARVITIVVIWAAIALSLYLLDGRQLLNAWSGAAVVGAALIGSIVVARFRRGAARADDVCAHQPAD